MNEHWQIILVTFLIQSIFGLGFATIAFFIKRSIGQIDKRLEAGDNRFADFTEKISALQTARGFDREYTAKTYVDKDDFIRDMRAFDFKIDGIGTDVKKLLILSGREPDHGEI